MSNHVAAGKLAQFFAVSAKASMPGEHLHEHNIGWMLAVFMQASADDPNWARRVALKLDMDHNFKLYAALRQEVEKLFNDPSSEENGNGMA